MLSRPKNLDILLLFINLLIGSSLWAQTNSVKYLSSYQSAIGSNMSSLNGIYGLLGNPGSIAQSSSDFAIIASTEQRFFLGSLNSTSVASIKKIGTYDFLGISFGSFGIDEYKERQIALSYSRKVGENISIGSRAHFYQKSITEYGSENDYDISIGVKSSISDQIEVGVVAFNILSNKSQGYLRENTEVAAGLTYLLSDKVNWFIEMRSDFADHYIFSTGISYQVLDPISLQIGSNTLDNGISIGMSYNLNSKWKLNASSRSNQNLGISPGFSMLFEK